MKIFNQDELKRKIKANIYAPVYFLCGNEPYLIAHYTNLIIKNNVTAFEDINVKFYDSSFDIDEISCYAYQVPMISPKKCIVITDCDFNDIDSKTLDAFINLVSEPSDVAIVIFRYTGMEISLKAKSYGKSNEKRDKFLNALESGGGFIAEINRMTTGVLVKTLSNGALKRNCSLDSNVARYMIERCSDDLTTLLTEIEKLCAYVKSGAITKEHIDKICIRSVSVVIYDMAKAVLANNVSESMRILDDLLFRKVKDTDIVKELAKNYIDIYRVSAAKKIGASINEVGNDFNYGNRTFVLSNASRIESKLSQKQIFTSLLELCEAEAMLKGASSLKNKTILQVLLIKLMMIATKEG